MILELNGTKVTIVDKTLGYQGDNFVNTIQVTVDKDSTWNYKLDMYKGKSKCFDSVLMTREGNTCTVQLTNEILSYGGRYIFQLRGYTDTQTYHSDIFESWVNTSIEYQYDCKQGDCECDCKLPTEFYQVEDNVTEINNHPPYPGDNNKWMIWDVGKHEYVESDIEVIAGGEDYQTKDNLTTSITAESTDEQYPSAKATYDAIEEAKADILQPDYNQNDETAKDYIKNRPFYTGDPVETVFVEESTVAFTEYSGLYGAEFPSTFEATVGETYKVSWDGTVYECTCVDLDDILALGNLFIMGEGSDTGEPFLMSIMNGEGIMILTADTSASHTFSISGMVASVVTIDPKYLPMPISFKPAGKSYLTFSSPFSFTLGIYDATKHWDGTLEYFASDKTWTVWDGTTKLSSVDNDGEYVLYLRGTGNTVITGSSEKCRWVLIGSDIACIGNIDNLLDYATVEFGEQPTMANYCYACMFQGCSALTQAPELPATALANLCYYHMFFGCSALTQAPELPATTLARGCYVSMFFGCKGLTQAPELPATTLNLQCYYHMFENCTSLTKAPELPATTLATSCYERMFYGCKGLTQIPALPATTLEAGCYHSMFSGCTSLKLSSTRTGEYTQEYRIPSSGNGVTATNALTDMFTSTGGTFTGTPTINTTYYLSSDNMIVRETEIATLNDYVGSMIDANISLGVTGASVGDIIKVKAVDDSGKPTEWETVTAKLANPNALTFTGAVTGSYDGSAPLSVEIPSGGGGAGAELLYSYIVQEDNVAIDSTSFAISPGIEAWKFVELYVRCNLIFGSGDESSGILYASGRRVCDLSYLRRKEGGKTCVFYDIKCNGENGERSTGYVSHAGHYSDYSKSLSAPFDNTFQLSGSINTPNVTGSNGLIESIGFSTNDQTGFVLNSGSTVKIYGIRRSDI